MIWPHCVHSRYIYQSKMRKIVNWNRFYRVMIMSTIWVYQMLPIITNVMYVCMIYLSDIKNAYHTIHFRLSGKHCCSQLGYHTVYPKKYAHGSCFAVLCCGYTLTDFPISIRLTSLALWQSNDCPSASKATLMNMDKYVMWTHYERLHNHNKAKHNKTVCTFLGIYCTL